MAWFRERRDDLEARLERELRDHVALEAEDNGGNPDAARRALGNRTLLVIATTVGAIVPTWRAARTPPAAALQSR